MQRKLRLGFTHIPSLGFTISAENSEETFPEAENFMTRRRGKIRVADWTDFVWREIPSGDEAAADS
jgi:hypothetical protein